MITKILAISSSCLAMGIGGTIEQVPIGWLIGGIGTTASLVYWATRGWQRVEDRLENVEKRLEDSKIVEQRLSSLELGCAKRHLYGKGK